MRDRPRRDAKAVFLETVENSMPLYQSLSGLSRIILPEAGGDESPLVTSTSRGTGEPPPERVGRYRIDGEIARGGIGAVYKAHDEDLGRSLAVKLLLDEHRRNPEMLQRFMEEAQISGQLQHPGIVPVHDVGLYAAEKPYFAMKLIKGQTLAKVLDAREDRVGDRQRFLAIFEKICETIAYAHARGVIHRDLKPSNVMIGSFGEVQVVDWGLAKVLARAAGSTRDDAANYEADHTAVATLRSGSTVSDSLAGTVLGTPAYMSPEQARGEIDELDERSDVFGLGAILCEILTGKPPYEATTANELLRQARNGDLGGAFACIDACGADRKMIELVKRCIAFEPRKRPRDAGAVMKDVRGYLESLEKHARSMKIRAAQARMRIALALTVFTALSLGAGVTRWLVEEHAQRVEQASSALAGMVSEARELKAAAEARDPADEAAWRRALLAARGAERRLTAGVDEDIRRSLDRLRSEIDNGLKKSRFLARIEDLRDVPLEFDRNALAELDSGYAIALKEFLGRDLEAMELHEATDLLRSHPLAEELTYAIRDWTMIQYMRTFPTEESWGALLEKHWQTKLVQILVGGADQLPTRYEWSRFAVSGTPLDVGDQAFIDLINTVSTSDLLLLARAVSLRKDYAPAEVVLRTALRSEPGSYRVHYDLGRLLRDQGKYDEALRHALAARSLRPDRPWAWWLLGTVLENLRDDDGALEAYAQAAVLDPSQAKFYLQLRDLAELEDRPRFGDKVLEHSMSSLDRLLASETAVPPEARAALDALLYGSITRELDEPETLIAEGAIWRYHAALQEPSPGLEWTTPEFDDSAWPQGKSGFGYGDFDDATILGDMRGNFSKVYVRCALDLPDPARFERLELSLRVDDGCVVYLNGQLLFRVRVSPEGLVQNAPEPLTEEVIEIPLEDLREGRNLIAIEGFNQPAASSDFSLIPVVRGKLAPGAARERDRERVRNFRERVSEPRAETRVTYFEGQVLRRAGQEEEARGRFAEAFRANPVSAATAYTLLVCLLEATSLQPVESELRDLFARSESLSERFWDAGLRTALVDRAWSPEQILALLPPKVLPPKERRSGWDEVRRFLERLRDGEVIRINCGGKRYVSASGAVWDRDRFYSGGELYFQGARSFRDDIHGTEDDPIYATERWVPLDSATPLAYHVPLLDGDYRVALHFAEIFEPNRNQRVFDVVIEGETILSNFRLLGYAVPVVRSFDVRVDDRVLDIDMIARENAPKISGIEIRRID